MFMVRPKLAWVAILGSLLGWISSFAWAQQRPLTIVSFGGAYGAIQDTYQVSPFRDFSNQTVLFESYAGGIAEIKAQVESGTIQWDIVDIESIDLERACAEGLLEELPFEQLAAATDGTTAADDFLPEALENECGVGQMIWSTVFAYHADTLTESPIDSIHDFFDLDKIPGKRGLRKRPQVNLEWALLADGVAADQVYEVLATDEGQTRAFNKLNSIKEHIIWFDSWSQAPQLLNDGAAVLVQSAHGRFYDARMNEGKPFVIVWDGHVYDIDVWAIVKNSPHFDTALEFIAFATATEPLAGFGDLAYAPTRRSSLAHIDEAVHPYLPTTHLSVGLKANSEFWADYGEILGEKFNEWLLQ